MPKNEKPRLFLLILFCQSRKKVTKNCFFQLSKGVSCGTLSLIALCLPAGVQAFVPLLPPNRRTGQLTFPRTASALKTSLTLYESRGGNSIIIHATKLNF
jgi:hypothetical protein